MSESGFAVSASADTRRISGTDLLPRLTDAALKDIGVSALGDRLRPLDAIAALAGPKPPGAVPASPSKPSPPKGPEVAAERRPITVMFCDLAGSTSLAAKLDPEDWRNLVNAYLDEASKAVTELGGHVLKKLGDGLMALFGYPRRRRTTPNARCERHWRSGARSLRSTSGTVAKGRRSYSRGLGLKAGQLSWRRPARCSATRRTSPLAFRPPPSPVQCSSP
jgi:class 3 adenylate cyclase